MLLNSSQKPKPTNVYCNVTNRRLLHITDMRYNINFSCVDNRQNFRLGWTKKDYKKFNTKIVFGLPWRPDSSWFNQDFIPKKILRSG